MQYYPACNELNENYNYLCLAIEVPITSAADDKSTSSAEEVEFSAIYCFFFCQSVVNFIHIFHLQRGLILNSAPKLQVGQYLLD